MISRCVIVPVEIGNQGCRGPAPDKESTDDVLNPALAGWLTREQWNERARDVGLRTSRKADLHDLRTALLHKRLVYESNGLFRVRQP